MKKLSKLMALLLALVLVFGTVAGAVAEGTITTQNEYFEAAHVALHNFIMGTATWGEYWDVAQNIAEENFDEFYYEYLSEDERTAMAERMEGLFWDSCISYTDVGPFLPAVDVSTGIATRAFALKADASTTENGLILNKTANANGDGTYTVKLEAYVTGKVTTTTTTTTVPCDIVLVLDMSNSMSQDFGNTSRIEALKTAVKNFIAATAEKYDATTADHRISIVGYNRTASVQAQWTYVNADGSTSLQNTVTSMSQSQGTNTDLGLATANTQLTTNYNYSGSNATRQKVVILFTDGVPGTSANDFSESVAATAITNAKTIKDGGATVYSVAIYDDADPSTAVQTTPTSNVLKINAMLHAISSNYPDATATGNNNTLTVTYGDGGNNGYYLTAESPDDLNNIFTTISDNIQTGSSSMELGSTTVVQDIISPYFTLPTGANEDDIILTEAAYTGDDANGNPTWATATTSAADATVSGKTINVNGFNFKDNAVMTVNGVNQGKKLIITFNVVTEPNFLGGNGVITNASAGVYVPDSQGNLGDPIELFNQPTVNTPVQAITPAVEDQNVYLTNPADLSELLQALDSRIDGTNNDYVDVTYTITDASGNVIAQLVVSAGETAGIWKDASGNEITDMSTLQTVLTADTTSYTVTCLVDGDGSGTSNEATETDSASVNVFKPVFTFHDTKIEYLAAEPTDDQYTTNNFNTTVTWEHPDSTGTPSGTAPTNFDFDFTATDGIENGKVTATDYVPVDVVEILVGSTTIYKVTDSVVTINLVHEFKHTSCPHNGCDITAAECQWNTVTGGTADGSPAFLLHVYNVVGDLTIEKTGLNVKTYADSTDPVYSDNESAVFTVVGDFDGDGQPETFTVIIPCKNGSGSRTLTGLRVGEYTVTELTNWTWRYDTTTYVVGSGDVQSGNEGDVEVEGGKTAIITFTNSGHDDQWLGGDNYAVNTFSK